VALKARRTNPTPQIEVCLFEIDLLSEMEISGASDKTLYNWDNRFKIPEPQRADQDTLASENKRLRAELLRMT